MSSRRLFKRDSVNVPGARSLPAYAIQCCECAETEKTVLTTHGKSAPPEAIAGVFRNKGWLVGTRDTKDVCPACQAKKRRARAKFCEEEGTNIIHMTTTTERPEITAEPPREMTREHKRIIIAKIEEVYVDENVGYGDGWSDARVAKDLGVPLAWVKRLREEIFGVEGASEEARALLSEAQSLAAQARALNDEMSGKIEAEKARRDKHIATEAEARRKFELVMQSYGAKRAALMSAVDRIEPKIALTLKAFGK